MEFNRQKKRGSTVTTFVLSLTALMGMSAMALNIGSASVERAQLRGATASAVLAAAQAFDGSASGAASATTLVGELLTQNGFGGLSPTVTPGVWTEAGGFVPGGAVANYNAVTVNISKTAGFGFASGVGMGISANIGAVQTRRAELPAVCNPIVDPPVIPGCVDDTSVVICHDKDEDDKTTYKLSAGDTDHNAHLADEKDKLGPCGDDDKFDFETDSDCDGISNEDEGKETDSDKDGTPDYKDTDSDDDGISDSDEGAGDFDGDHTPDYLDTDSDDDGISDKEEGAQDLDDDGKGNYKDTDADGDGESDKDEGKASDEDDDSVPDYLDPNNLDSCSTAMSRLFQ